MSNFITVSFNASDDCNRLFVFVQFWLHLLIITYSCTDQYSYNNLFKECTR